MSPNSPLHPPDPPLPPEWLAGLADQELTPDGQARVEAALKDSAFLQELLADQQQMQAWCAQTTPREPGADRWHAVLQNVTIAVTEQTSPQPRARSRRLWLYPTVAGVAAALTLISLGQLDPFSLRRSAGPRPIANALSVATDQDITIDAMDPADHTALVVGCMPRHPEHPLRPGTRLAVIEPHDVVIQRMEAADTSALVVATPPIIGPLVLATPDDIHVEHIAPAPADALRPVLHISESRVPMLLAPLPARRE